MPKIICLFVFFLSLFVSPGLANTNTDNSVLVAIEDETFTVFDFKKWWEFYRDDESQKIDTIMPFVEWHLMLNEAKLMELDSLPEYLHKVDVFTKSRTLMLLKNEEVDSKIILPDELLYQEYLSQYVPRRLVALVECVSFDAAKTVKASVPDKTSIDNLDTMIQEINNDCLFHSPQWLRPHTTPADWSTLLKNTKQGQLSSVFSLTGGQSGILFVAEKIFESQDDFLQRKNAIFDRLRKKKDQELTEKLLIELKKKYNIKVDQQLLDAIDIVSPDPETLDEIVISSDRSNVTVGYLIEQSKRDQAFLKNQRGKDRDSQQIIKSRLVNAMISNSLVSWEAEERNYGAIPPFKWDLQFYKQYRLVKAVETRLYDDIRIEQSEIMSFYNDNLKKYTHPEKVKVILLQDAYDTIYKVWTKTLVGGDILAEAKNENVSIVSQIGNELPLTHFYPETVEVLKNLEEGQISLPYKENEATKLVKLISRIGKKVDPLGKVQGSISDLLMNKAKESKRKGFLDKLKAKSTIAINEKNWMKFIGQQHL